MATLNKRNSESLVTRDELSSFIDQYGDLPGEVTIGLEAVRLYCTKARHGRLIACVKIQPINWYQADLSHLVVHPAHRRRGVASELIEAACQRARAADCRLVQATICRNNVPAENLFRASGFTPSVSFVGLSGRTLLVWSTVL